MSAAISPAESRLRRRASEYAAQLASGTLALEQLRARMADELRVALTAAMLSGTGSQRSPEIDAALRTAIQRDLAELDRLIALLQSRPEMDAGEIERRLSAFADGLEDVQNEGERLTENPVNPLVPAAIGGALGALIGRITTPGRTVLPRLDSGTADRAYAELQRRMDELSELYANGELLPDDWLIRMQREVQLAHRSLYQIGRGGALSTDDLARLDARVRAQLEFLDGFRGDLEALTPAQIKARARMYLNAGKSSLQEGATARLGLPALPCFPGERSICQTNCRCTWRIQTLEGNGNANAYWLIQAGESCETCVNRAALWNPIEIRNGVLGPYSRVGTFA